MKRYYTKDLKTSYARKQKGIDLIELEEDEINAFKKPILKNGKIIEEGLSKEELLKDCIDQRKIAYKNESDQLYMEAIFDNDDEKMTIWRDKVKEIKKRFPK